MLCWKSAGLLIWWVWTLALFTKNKPNQQQKKTPKLHTPASLLRVLEDLARKEIVRSWLQAEYTGTFDPGLSVILQKKEWALAKKATEILAGTVLTPFPEMACECLFLYLLGWTDW